MTTAQVIIEAGYARSSANDPGKLGVDGELLGLLNRAYHALYALAAAAAPERFAARTTLTIGGSPLGVTLPVGIIDIRRIQRASGAKVNVIPLEEQDKTWHLTPRVFREGNRLYSVSQVGDPSNGEVLTMWYLDAPADLVGLASTLDDRFPTRHHELLVLTIAIYLATKEEGRGEDVAKLKTERDFHLEMFLQLSGLSMTALSTPHGGIIVQRLNQLMSVMGKAA